MNGILLDYYHIIGQSKHMLNKTIKGQMILILLYYAGLCSN